MITLQITCYTCLRECECVMLLYICCVLQSIFIFICNVLILYLFMFLLVVIVLQERMFVCDKLPAFVFAYT